LVVAHFDNGLMKFPVVRDEGLHELLALVMPSLLHNGTEVSPVPVLIYAFCRQSRRLALQGLPYLKKVDDFRARQTPDDGPAIRNQFDQPVSGQASECLAQRPAADAQLFNQVPRDQALARSQAA